MCVTSLTEPLLKPKERMSNAERNLKSGSPNRTPNVAGWNKGLVGVSSFEIPLAFSALRSPPKTVAHRERRAPIIHRKLWLAVFAAEMAEAAGLPLFFDYGERLGCGRNFNPRMS